MKKKIKKKIREEEEENLRLETTKLKILIILHWNYQILIRNTTVGHKNLNKVSVPRVVSMAEEATR